MTGEEVECKKSKVNSFSIFLMKCVLVKIELHHTHSIRTHRYNRLSHQPESLSLGVRIVNYWQHFITTLWVIFVWSWWTSSKRGRGYRTTRLVLIGQLSRHYGNIETATCNLNWWDLSQALSKSGLFVQWPWHIQQIWICHICVNRLLLRQQWEKGWGLERTCRCHGDTSCVVISVGTGPLGRGVAECPLSPSLYRLWFHYRKKWPRTIAISTQEQSPVNLGEIQPCWYWYLESYVNVLWWYSVLLSL